MDHSFTSAEDFLHNDSFLRYCMGLDEKEVLWWDTWIQEHPEHQAHVDQAREIFNAINGQQGQLHAAVGHFRVLLREHATQTATQEPATPTPPVRGQQRRLHWWHAAAAIALLLTAAGGWYQYSHYRNQQQIAARTRMSDVQPGSSRAMLTLADGTSVPLDSTGAGRFQEKDGTRINKGQGTLTYDNNNHEEETVLFNTLSTPRGGEYQLVLPDGSRVWLNAASSLRFPTRFTGKDRTVYLTGEAYFEIAPNASQAFHVQLNNGQQIAVLGTSFNVMDYEDEHATQTTLVTGKVKVTLPGGQQTLLAPAQQATITKGSDRIAVTDADIDKTIAWKTGTFEFDEDELPTIMRQLARWYDVRVVYAGTIPTQHYSGSIRKQATLSQALRILQTAGIHYSVTDKTITIQTTSN
ncbi:FecR family protein [Chitinophaga sp. HK235]|uniref:FecR family protein n=1 Tax=Chitinophaga sp. HK235 TaxID=2952571 RepID=UPI001BAE2086|nr:FecR family protein [Chitinophaga sp. HK235]